MPHTLPLTGQSSPPGYLFSVKNDIYAVQAHFVRVADASSLAMALLMVAVTCRRLLIGFTMIIECGISFETRNTPTVKYEEIISDPYRKVLILEAETLFFVARLRR